jgi:putative transposase
MQYYARFARSTPFNKAKPKGGVEQLNTKGKQCGLITPNAQFLSLGATEALRRQAYRGLFETHMGSARIDDIRRSTNGNFVLGGDRFKAEIATMLKRRVSPGKAGRPAKRD